MISFSGKSVLITGASRGIGAATAVLFARAGADVGIAYHRRKDEAEKVADEVRNLGRRAWVAGGDLADLTAADRLVRACAEEFGRLDGFIANAGIWPVADVPLKDLPPERWRLTLGANLDSVYATTRAALGVMQRGAVVLVSSTAGQRGEAYHADYAATKGAIISLTKSLAIECAPEINVNCVAPGWVETEMSEAAYAGGGRERIARTIPLQRIATAEDIAGAILFLCSHLARHITGEVLNVNGGSVLCG
ncbi:MAG: SDR family NAD(P)-dependent oxidoreductase [Gemmatimonadales bacterium]